jgi:hypothetical protein
MQSQSWHRPGGYHRSSVRDKDYSSGYKAIWYALTQYIQSQHVPTSRLQVEQVTTQD